MPKVIAVQKGGNLDPAEAIFVFETDLERPMRWWQGPAWEDLDLPVDAFKCEFDDFRPCELDLPEDWEEGRVVIVSGEASFRYYEEARGIATDAGSIGAMVRRRPWLAVTSLACLIVLAGAWLLHDGDHREEPSELFRKHIVDPIPPSVMDIKVEQTRVVFGFVYQFKIEPKDFALILESGPFQLVMNVRYEKGTLDWDWGPTAGVTIPVYEESWRGSSPAWLNPSQWQGSKAYALRNDQPGRTITKVLIYDETLGEVHCFAFCNANGLGPRDHGIW